MKKQPTLIKVESVYCKNCKHRDKEIHSLIWTCKLKPTIKTGNFILICENYA